MTAPNARTPREPTTGRRFAEYVGWLCIGGILLLGAAITVDGLFGALPIGLIGVLYISINLGRSIGWIATLAPPIAGLVWAIAAGTLITTAFDGPSEQESEGWSVLFAILGIGFAIIVAEAGIIGGLIWRTVTRRRAAAAPPEPTTNALS